MLDQPNPNDRSGLAGAQAAALASLLCCPACGHHPLRFAAAEVVCEGCGRHDRIIDGILDFIGESAEPRPAFYRDPAYQTFVAGLDALHGAHYQAGGVSAALELRMKQDLSRLMTRSVAPVFDIGCGAGGGFEQFGPPDRIVGIDSELKLLQIARERYPQATLVRAALQNLPLRPASIQTIVASAVIEHVFYLERTLENIARCLAPDGRFFVMIPTEGGFAVEAARLVTSQRNAKVLGITPAESRRAQRKDHCNTIFAIENALRKHFVIEETAAWPFRIGGSLINLTKSYRLSPIKP